MTDEAEIHANKRTDKTYVSPRIPTIRGALRIASKVIDSEGMHFTTVKDEVLLRRTPSGRTEIIAKFLEDDRNVTVLTLQSFNGNSGLPHQTHFSFVGSEVPKLLEFFRSITSVDLSDGSALNITDTALQKLLLSKDQADSLVHENPKFVRRCRSRASHQRGRSRNCLSKTPNRRVREATNRQGLLQCKETREKRERRRSFVANVL